MPFTNPGATPFNNALSGATPFNSTLLGTTNPASFTFTQQPVQTPNTSSISDLLKSTTVTSFNTSTFGQQQQTPIKMNSQPPTSSISDNKNLLQMVFKH